MQNPKKKFLPLLLILIALCLSAVQPVLAQADEQPQVTITPDRSELTVGDVVTLSLEIRHPQGTRVVFPPLEQTLGDFEILSQSESQTAENEDNSLTSRQTLQVTLFAPGEYSFPQPGLTYIDKNGSQSELTIPDLTLTVHSVLVEGDTELRDIKPQAEFFVLPIWAWVLIGAALTALLVWLLVRWLKKRKNKVKAAEEFVDLRPAHEIALQEIERIRTLNLPAQGNFKEHYSLLADCLRSYLEKRFDIRATERTTSEIRSNLKDALLDSRQRLAFTEVLSAADLVKFARFKPSESSANSILSEAEGLVRETIPQPSAPAPGDEEGGRP